MSFSVISGRISWHTPICLSPASRVKDFAKQACNAIWMHEMSHARLIYLLLQQNVMYIGYKQIDARADRIMLLLVVFRFVLIIKLLLARLESAVEGCTKRNQRCPVD